MLLEKEAYINKIEAEVLDVNQIMQELAELVNAQAQSVGKNISTIIIIGLVNVIIPPRTFKW